MALVLTAGVVHAQNNPNFSDRANLTQANRLDAEFPQTLSVDTWANSNNSDYEDAAGWDGGDNNKLFWSNGHSYEFDIISESRLASYLNGRNLLDVFENFVIRTGYTDEWEHYYGMRKSTGEQLSSPVAGITNTNTDAISYSVKYYGLDPRDNQLKVISKMNFWGGDVRIAPLRALCGTNSEFDNIADYHVNQPLPEAFCRPAIL